MFNKEKMLLHLVFESLRIYLRTVAKRTWICFEIKNRPIWSIFSNHILAIFFVLVNVSNLFLTPVCLVTCK